MDRKFPIYRSINSLDVTDEQIEEAVEKVIKEEFDGSEVKDISVEVGDMTVYVELSNNEKGFGLYYKLKDRKLVLIDRKRFIEGRLVYKRINDNAETINALLQDCTAVDNDCSESDEPLEAAEYTATDNESTDVVNLPSEEEHTIINEINPSTSQSIKNDFADKKPRWDLLPIEELGGVVDVYTAGAKKYGENRWQTLPNGINRYLGAFFRHITAHKRGEYIDPEDGCLHIDKCIWNMIAVRHCFLADKGINPNTSDYSALQQEKSKD